MAARIHINSRKNPSVEKSHPLPEDTYEGSGHPIEEEASMSSDSTTSDDSAGSLNTPDAKESEANEAEMQRLQAREQELSDQLLRAVADMENVRRRSRLEREEAVQFGTRSLIEDLLPIIDNLERALAAQAATKEAVVEGVTVTLRQFHDVLLKHGVEGVPGVGEPFDAEHHEAIMQAEPTDDFPAGTVVDEMRRGYRLRGRLIRPSLVKVAQA